MQVARIWRGTASLDESASSLRGVALRPGLRDEERHLRVALCVTAAALGSAILVTLALALFGRLA